VFLLTETDPITTM